MRCLYDVYVAKMSSARIWRCVRQNFTGSVVSSAFSPRVLQEGVIMHPSDSSAQAVHDSILIVLQNMSKLKTENLAHEATVSPSVRFASHADPLYFTAWGRGRKASSTGL